MGKTSLDYFGGLKAILTPWSLPYKMVTGEGFLKFQQENSKDGQYFENYKCYYL